MKFREWLWKERLSVTRLALKIGVSRQQLNRVKLGQAEPSLKTAFLIEDYTNGQVTARELVRHQNDVRE